MKRITAAEFARDLEGWIGRINDADDGVIVVAADGREAVVIPSMWRCPAADGPPPEPPASEGPPEWDGEG